MKTQKVNYKGKEEFEDKNKNDTEGALKHFQNLQKVGFFFMIPQLFYRPDDVENTTKFFDKKFPEVRKLFQLKYEEKGINNLAFNNKTVEKMYLEYMDMRLKITKAVDNSYLESVKILHGQESKNCFDKNQNNTMEVSDLWEKK
uniref:Uncharacterized protein n=1 Tax=Meloidogyne hapla TaxID=6305 RepID=A0A1I8BJA1_MELHA